MNTNDPLHHIESLVRKTHDTLGATTQPVLKRYPLLFSFLVILAVASIFQGFEFVVRDISLFNNHPWILIVGGVVILTFTGSLYKWLDRNS